MPGTARRVTLIPPTVNTTTRQPVQQMQKRKTAGYARVSTDSDEQFTSYEAQIDYYTNYIKSHEEWEFVKVYTDEGISGLSTKNRDGFNEMVSDALAGKIDLIVTKSVSRFARNTVDSLMTIRKLKDAGCECYFEKEGIYTFDGKGELLLTIMSSLAQEESRSISENVTWGQRKRFADGKVSMPYKKFLGYRKGPDGLPQVVPEEAEVVRKIYDLYMLGKTPFTIAGQLTKEGIPTPGKKTIWSASTVQSILTNEKYKGDARLQKTFTVDFLQKKMKKNEGEVPQYYVTNSHEPIIGADLFDLVQTEIARRKSLGNRYSGNGIFASRIICADCGGLYGRKVWNSTRTHRIMVWQCNEKFKNGDKCKTPHLTEDEIKARFLTAFNRLIPDRERLVEDCRLMKQEIADCREVADRIEDCLREIEVIEELRIRCVDESGLVNAEQSDVLARFNELTARGEKMRQALQDLERLKAERTTKARMIDGFIRQLQEREQPLTVFDEKLWADMIDHVLVHQDGVLEFCFRNGTVIRV